MGVPCNFYQVYVDEGSGKNTFAKRMTTIALTINTVSLILCMSVVVVVVTLTMSLVRTETSTHPLKEYERLLPGRRPYSPGDPQTFSSFMIDKSSIESKEQEQEKNTDLTNSNDAFYEILGVCPLIVISSLIGVYAAQRSSSTGVIVLYWLTLTGTLLITTYVTSKFVEYETLFDSQGDLNDEEEVPPRSPIEIISRLMILIGALQMISAIIVTVAKFQKTRVAIKLPSITDLSATIS